jgi:hypothetical protein
MLNKLKEAYRQISLEDKRNELNKELLSLLMMSNLTENNFNYIKSSGLSEDEYLTETYIQIIELKNKLIEMLGQKGNN